MQIQNLNQMHLMNKIGKNTKKARNAKQILSGIAGVEGTFDNAKPHHSIKTSEIIRNQKMKIPAKLNRGSRHSKARKSQDRSKLGKNKTVIPQNVVHALLGGSKIGIENSTNSKRNKGIKFSFDKKYGQTYDNRDQKVMKHMENFPQENKSMSKRYRNSSRKKSKSKIPINQCIKSKRNLLNMRQSQDNAYKQQTISKLNPMIMVHGMTNVNNI